MIAEEAARFRAMSPQDRMRALRGLLAAGFLTMLRSPKAVSAREYTLEQEELSRQAVKELMARHGG